jgi:uncharacterized membrane protein
MNWFHLGSVTLTSFLASLVEFVEALTIVLAVGTTRNWRSAFAGTLAAIVALVAVILIAGPSIQKIPIQWMQLVVGTIVAAFGFRWLKKATLRSAGVIPFHDEDLEYSKQVRLLKADDNRVQLNSIDKIAFVTTFKAVFLEGFEVAFIVITAGSVSGHFVPAFIGAAIALLFVIGLGLVLHHPLSKVPENTLKKSVGVLLSAFGIYWVGEGLGFEWPFADASILILVGLLAAASFSISKGLHRTR